MQRAGGPDAWRGAVRILVIEDDPATARLVRMVLSEDGHAVDVAPSGDEGRVLALVQDYDGIVLDLGLGDRHGVDVLQALRRAGKTTPVLVFTGSEGDESVVRALDAGADEYVVKPVSNSELRARVRALVRRGVGPRGTALLAVGNVVLDRLARVVRVGAGELPVTPLELRFLEYLMLRAGAVATRQELLDKVWGMRFDPGSNVVDVHAGRLRRKLERAGATAALVGRRGFGYVLAAEPPPKPNDGAAGRPDAR